MDLCIVGKEKLRWSTSWRLCHFLLKWLIRKRTVDTTRHPDGASMRFESRSFSWSPLMKRSSFRLLKKKDHSLRMSTFWDTVNNFEKCFKTTRIKLRSSISTGERLFRSVKYSIEHFWKKKSKKKKIQDPEGKC